MTEAVSPPQMWKALEMDALCRKRETEDDSGDDSILENFNTSLFSSILKLKYNHISFPFLPSKLFHISLFVSNSQVSFH